MKGYAAPSVSLVRDPLPGWLAAIGSHWLIEIDLARAAETPPPDPRLPIARLAAALALDGPAVALVELLVAAEIDTALAGRLVGDRGVTVALARRLLPRLDPRDLALAGALRSHDVVRVSDDPRALATLRIGEAMLDWLCGGAALDPWVATAVRAIDATETPPPGLGDALGDALAKRSVGGLSPVVAAGALSEGALAAALAAIGLTAWRLLPEALPADPADRLRWARLWSRDAGLGDAVLVVTPDDDMPWLGGLIDGLIGHVVTIGDEPLSGLSRAVQRLAPSEDDHRVARWRTAFGDSASERLGFMLAGAARRFALDAGQLARLAAETAPQVIAEPDDRAAARLVWHGAARSIAPRAVPGCTQREATGEWADLVLAVPIKEGLSRIEAHVRHAEQVLHHWGFADRMGGRGTGIAALFAGPSGTGKTMAAEIIAAALGLPMLVVDLARLSSKFIGETSKNVAAVFAEAERTGAVIVLNEGEAVFGARGQVVHAVDRHMNSEVGDLLERLEAFTGLTIVTTNMKSSIDPAFLRRFRFIVDFPMPSEMERREIWTRAFPEAAPVALEEQDYSALGSVAVSGGSIRNAALAAAFAAAQTKTSIVLDTVAEALGRELAKTGQSMPKLVAGTAA